MRGRRSPASSVTESVGDANVPPHPNSLAEHARTNPATEGTTARHEAFARSKRSYLQVIDPTEITPISIRELFRRRHAPMKQAGRRRSRSRPGNLHGRAVPDPAGRRSLRRRDVGSIRRRGGGSHPALRDGKAMSVLLRPELREPPMPFNRPRNPPSRRRVRPTLAERAPRHITGRTASRDGPDRASEKLP